MSAPRREVATAMTSRLVPLSTVPRYKMHQQPRSLGAEQLEEAVGDAATRTVLCCARPVSYMNSHIAEVYIQRMFSDSPSIFPFLYARVLCMTFLYATVLCMTDQIMCRLRCRVIRYSQQDKEYTDSPCSMSLDISCRRVPSSHTCVDILLYCRILFCASVWR